MEVTFAKKKLFGIKMYLLPLVAFILLFSSFTISWETDFETAKQQAKDTDRYLLLNFSGSDWCGPCRRFKQDFLESEIFKQYADSNLVLINADFPRQNKNQLPKVLQQQNDKLAEQYNPEGSFPATLLLDASGKVLKKWIGVPKGSVDDFVNEIDQVAHTRAD